MEGGAFSLPMLRPNGLCRASNCRLVHADRPSLTALCERPAEPSTCCACHNEATEPVFLRSIPENLFITIVGCVPAGKRPPVRCGPVPVRRFGHTQALVQFLNQIEASTGTTVIVESKVCRLHLTDRCRHGGDCKNFHVCREVWAASRGPPRKRRSSGSSGDSRGFNEQQTASWCGTEDECPTSVSSLSVSPAASECPPFSSSLTSLSLSGEIIVEREESEEVEWRTQPPTPTSEPNDDAEPRPLLNPPPPVTPFAVRRAAAEVALLVFQRNMGNVSWW